MNMSTEERNWPDFRALFVAILDVQYIPDWSNYRKLSGGGNKDTFAPLARSTNGVP